MPEDHHYWNCNNDVKKPDFWETWFLPISRANWRNISDSESWEFSQETIVTLHFDPTTIHAYPYDERDNGTAEWLSLQRSNAIEVNKKYIHVLPSLKEESEKLYMSMFKSYDEQVLGIHMRGTDKSTSEKVEPVLYAAHAERFLSQNPDGMIFLATDDEGYHRYMKQKFGPKLVSNSVLRVKTNVLYDDTVDKMQKTKDVLLDSLLLAQCTTLVKTWSGVSEFAVYFRQLEFPNLPAFTDIIDLQEMASPGHEVLNLIKRNKLTETYKANPCEQSDFVRNDTVYLPPSLKYKKCGLSNKSLEIQRHLSYLGSKQCDIYTSEGRIRPKMRAHLVELGFGATVNSVVKPMLHALKKGYCIEDPHGWNKYNCSHWTYLFKSVSVPSVGLELVEPILEDGNEFGPKFDYHFCHLVFQGQNRWDWEYPGWKQCSKDYSAETHGVSILPQPYQKQGLFFTVANILSFLLRPSRDFAARVEATKTRMGWPTDKPVLALHVRHGDSCLEAMWQQSRRCDSLATHMKAVDIVARKYGIKHIYMATDSDKVWEDMKLFPEYTFLLNRKIGRGGKRDHKSIDKLLEARELDGCKEAGDVQMDLALLGSGDAFVGKFTSNIDRIAYALQYANAKTYTPYVSLDAPWCFDFGVRSGRTIDGGDFFC